MVDMRAFEGAKRTEGTAPVVFHFQPKYYVEVETAEQAQLWEKLFAEECGVKLQEERPSLWKESGKDWVRCESISGSWDGWDDCDQYC